jgi:hypothetical protein
MRLEGKLALTTGSGGGRGQRDSTDSALLMCKRCGKFLAIYYRARIIVCNHRI